MAAEHDDEAPRRTGGSHRAGSGGADGRPRPREGDGRQPGQGGRGGRGGGRRRRIAGAWRQFAASPFLPAVVIVLVASAGAGLFAGSYTYNMADPTPRRIPTAVVGDASAPGARAFTAGLEKALDASLVLHPYADRAAAVRGVESQRVFAVVTFRSTGGRTAARMDVASAAGQSVAQVLATAAPKAARAAKVPLALGDLKPLQKGDPRGLAIFYITLSAVILGFVAAIQLSVNARRLLPFERVLAIAANSLLGAFTIAAVVDWWLGALRLPFVESWLILAFTMFTSGMVFTAFNTLFGRWALLPTWGLMVLLGNPSSGGAVSWPLLPSVLGRIGQWLPPGASVNAQHTAVYFGDEQHVFPYLVLLLWAAPATAVFWVWRHRHPGGRDPSPGGAPAHAADATAG
ncbi:ABC transporter permease [Streptomyces fuscigenes]|uniref:ABC transporter permease n=1 Tax=Streptomyces fuscigenes TaxID=1528880 RepID=UPI001F3B9996|nr:ABC transporter permease [Streptomyces fuscigenes]MCF3964072.1 ABC transporter permease [Streptomyces fuscigenes]